jgi:hypothetical protein
LSRHGRVGQEYDEDKAPNRAEGTDDDKLILPGCKRAFDVADAVTEQATESNACDEMSNVYLTILLRRAYQTRWQCTKARCEQVAGGAYTTWK